ncbi:MAG TPA: mechanosensitive ion channel domain-containing protein [Dongiaceae bacterium]|nr:mechanosensitive ion channel domain-containing protein [Dongiaceae bacterium]
MAMLNRQKIAAVVIVFLLLATVFGIWWTAQDSTESGAAKTATKANTPVDQRPLRRAQRLAQQATTHDEKPLAQEALRLADYDVDLAFADAIRDARLHPPPLSPQAKADKARLDKAMKVLESEQERAKTLAEQLAKAPAERQEAISADLIQAEADADLAQDEVDDAKHDFQMAGGDPVDRIQAMKNEHEETTHNTPTAIPAAQEPAEAFGVYHRAVAWKQLHDKQMLLWRVKGRTEEELVAVQAKHNALEAQIESAKVSEPELSHHAKQSNSAPGGEHVSAAEKSQTDTAALLKKTQQLTSDQKALEAYDKRIETKKELASVYGQWIELVGSQQKDEVHRALQGLVIILSIALIGIFFSSWLDSLVKKLTMDRRQVESLRTVARVSSQILALFLIALVILGPPGQLGTFLGLAGAGLTVALKDFIVGFVGWFVLMGKHGMRMGDWVEINGVTGEVVQIGPFHTVLLETGNWTDSGHPTGRRVTFTNSFAIEGHYFNFSTSGQWLWDELQVVLPTGQDPYPTVEAIRKKVEELTSLSANEAAKEWKDAAGSRELSAISVTPVVDVRPVVGGTQVVVRYITRANERSTLRTKLNMAAVELLGEGRSKEVMR